MRTRVIILFVFLFSNFIIIACSDDKNPVDSSDNIQPLLLVRGDVKVEAGKRLVIGNLRMWGLNKIEPEIDSVKIADSLCQLDNRPNIDELQVSYRDAVITFFTAGPNIYERGDSAEVEIFCPQGVSRGKVELLDIYLDKVAYLNTIPSSIMQGETIDLVWNKIDLAEWYMIKVDVFWGNPPVLFVENYHHTTDTTFTVDRADQYTTMLRIYVNAVSGPLPDESHNNFGNSIASGTLYSSSFEAYSGDITVSSPASDMYNVPEPEFPALIDFIGM